MSSKKHFPRKCLQKRENITKTKKYSSKRFSFFISFLFVVLQKQKNCNVNMYKCIENAFVPRNVGFLSNEKECL